MRRIVKPVLFVAALGPLAWLAWGMLQGTLGANPAETIQLQTGRWALKFLLITLAVTPVRRLTGWNVVIQYRRMLGLFAFFYASLHFTSYIVLDQFFDWRAILRDIPKRPFILMGFTAFVLMVPLALTSTKGWIRRLGRRSRRGAGTRGVWQNYATALPQPQRCGADGRHHYTQYAAHGGGKPCARQPRLLHAQ